MTGPLLGVRVVDLSGVRPGPVAAGILAHQGAEVIGEWGYRRHVIDALQAEGTLG